MTDIDEIKIWKDNVPQPAGTDINIKNSIFNISAYNYKLLFNNASFNKNEGVSFSKHESHNLRLIKTTEIYPYDILDVKYIPVVQNVNENNNLVNVVLTDRTYLKYSLSISLSSVLDFFAYSEGDNVYRQFVLSSAETIHIPAGSSELTNIPVHFYYDMRGQLVKASLILNFILTSKSDVKAEIALVLTDPVITIEYSRHLEYLNDGVFNISKSDIKEIQ